jgi:hypothetical protein
VSQDDTNLHDQGINTYLEAIVNYISTQYNFGRIANIILGLSGIFFSNHVFSLGLLLYKFDLLWFEHNCELSDMFRSIHGYFIDSSCMLLLVKSDLCK